MANGSKSGKWSFQADNSNHLFKFKAPDRIWHTLYSSSLVQASHTNKFQHQYGEGQSFPQGENTKKLHSKGCGCLGPLQG